MLKYEKIARAFTIFAKSSIIDFWQRFKCSSIKDNSNPNWENRKHENDIRKYMLLVLLLIREKFTWNYAQSITTKSVSLGSIVCIDQVNLFNLSETVVGYMWRGSALCLTSILKISWKEFCRRNSKSLISKIFQDKKTFRIIARKQHLILSWNDRNLILFFEIPGRI